MTNDLDKAREADIIVGAVGEPIIDRLEVKNNYVEDNLDISSSSDTEYEDD